MNVEFYYEFIVLAEELNFHEAARRLCMTQSTLSKHLATLEQHYGARLLERDRSHVQLTAKGSFLLECALAIWSEYEHSLELVKNRPDNARGLFISGILEDPFSFPLVSATLDRLRRAQHQSLPHFLPCSSASCEEQARLLRSDEADCAVLYLTEDDLATIADPGDFSWTMVARVPMDAVVRDTHPLASRTKIHADDLFDCTLIRLVGPRMTPIWKQLERQLHQAGVMFRTRPFAASSVYDYARLDPRDAVLLSTRPDAFSTPPQGNATVRIPVDDDFLHLDLCVLYLKSHRTPEMNSFIKALCSVYKKAYGNDAPNREQGSDSTKDPQDDAIALEGDK